MASLSTDSKGFHTVQFTDGNRRRKSIRLGKCSKRIAQTAQTFIGKICAAKKSGDALDGETARYIAGLSPEWAKKFAAAGLITARGSAFLGEFLRDLTDQHFDRAAESETLLQESALQKAVQSALQNAVRSMSDTSGQMTEKSENTPENAANSPLLSLAGLNGPNASFHPLGTEPRRS